MKTDGIVVSTAKHEKPVVLVTGAGSGMGLATATRLAAEGFAVVGGDLRTDIAVTTPGAERLSLDIREAASVDAFVAGALQRYGRIDALVNCAGIAQCGAIEEISIAEAQALFEVNFFGTARMARAVLPAMRERGRGHILNVSSGAAVVAEPFAGYYSASKFAVEGFTEALRFEASPFGIQVSVIVPGWTRTAIVSNSRVAGRSLPAYAANRQRVEGLVRDFVDAAPSPEGVATCILRVLRSPEPALRHLVGTDVTTSFWTRRFAPARLYERLVRSYYKLAA